MGIMKGFSISLFFAAIMLIDRRLYIIKKVEVQINPIRYGL